MKLLLDVNVFMDALERRRGWVHSLELINRVRKRTLAGSISALTIPIIYFLRLRHVAEQQARRDAARITKGFQIVPLTPEILDKALRSELPDFEDNIQLFSAQQGQVDYLVTRNKRHFRQGVIAVVTPEELLSSMSG